MSEKIKKYSIPALAFVLGFTSALGVLSLYEKKKSEKKFEVIVNENLPSKSETESALEKNAENLSESAEKIIGKKLSGDFENYEYIKVSDQKAGESVSLAFIKAESPVWIVVHEERDGKIWNVLGARLKDKGEYSGVEVPLLRASEAGKRYWVALYKDNGDSQFSLDSDFPLKLGGEYLMMPFNTIK